MGNLQSQKYKKKIHFTESIKGRGVGQDQMQFVWTEDSKRARVSTHLLEKLRTKAKFETWILSDTLTDFVEGIPLCCY